MKPKDLRQNYKSYPVRAATDYDLEGVKFALRSLEAGYLGDAALLCDAMTRDDRIRNAIDRRIDGLLSADKEIIAPMGGGEAVITELTARFDGILPRKALKRLLRWYLMLGVGLGELVWDYSTVPDRWIPRLKTWHPRYLRYDEPRGVYVLQTQSGPVDVEPGNGKWIVLEAADEMPWFEGLVRPLAIPWLIKQWAARDWARWSEIHGIPIIKAKVPQEVDPEIKDPFIAGLAELGSENKIVIPELANDQGAFDIELVEANSNSWQGFNALMAKCEASITITVLGQNLTTEVKGGSLAAAKEHGDVKDDVLASDAAMIGPQIGEQVLQPFVNLNIPAPVLIAFKFKVEPPADLKSESEVMNSVANAVNVFTAAGVEVDLMAVGEKFQIPILGRMAPAAPAQTDTPPNQAATNGPARPAPSQTPMSASRGGAKIVTLASGETIDLNSGFVQGQNYADRLTENARLATAERMDADIADILAIVQAAETPEEMRNGLIQLYNGMDIDAMAGVLEKAMVLANLAGRYALLEDL